MGKRPLNAEFSSRVQAGSTMQRKESGRKQRSEVVRNWRDQEVNSQKVEVPKNKGVAEKPKVNVPEMKLHTADDFPELLVAPAPKWLARGSAWGEARKSAAEQKEGTAQ